MGQGPEKLKVMRVEWLDRETMIACVKALIGTMQAAAHVHTNDEHVVGPHLDRVIKKILQELDAATARPKR